MKILISFFLLSFYVETFAQSDEKAIAIANKVTEAMGGKKAWDNTHFIAWNFFGSRKLTWDKWSGAVRIEGLKDSSIALINVNNDKGRIFRKGKEETNADSLTKFIKRAKSQWINDSYWLVMPLKLNDSGVTLKYLGLAKTETGEESEILSLTFDKVGDTPQNKYKVWVNTKTNLVNQWAYFADAKNEKPGFTMPWQNYTKYGNMLLTGDHGPRKLTEIVIYKKLPKTTFTQF